MPVPIIVTILAAVALLAVVVVAIIYYDDIIEWFRTRNDIKEADKDNIAFTIREKIETGDYKVVQGIFNKRTNDLVEGHAMKTKKLDSEFEQIHADNELVIYE